MGAVGAFALATGSKDAALVASLSPGAYTAPVAATDVGGGVALLEVYDASNSMAASVVNVSTRAYVGTGDNVLIPGFVIGGTGTLRLLIRAVGPTLSSFGVTGALADPTITLYRGTTALASNDNWSSAANAAEIASTAVAVGGFAFANGSRDAAILTTLEPGAYSAIISGVGNTTGTALMELYAVAGATPTTPIPTSVVASGATLNLYFTETVVLVYSSAGARLEQIVVPERPTNVKFSGSDRQTLFITTDAGSLYSIRMRVLP
jgi:hypothetical protein